MIKSSLGLNRFHGYNPNRSVYASGIPLSNTANVKVKPEVNNPKIKGQVVFHTAYKMNVQILVVSHNNQHHLVEWQCALNIVCILVLFVTTSPANMDLLLKQTAFIEIRFNDLL